MEVGETSQVTVLTNNFRPSPNNIVYDLLGIVYDVEIISNPSMNYSVDNSEGEVELLGSIVSE